jgi:ankyrin repeat protein
MNRGARNNVAAAVVAVLVASATFGATKAEIDARRPDGSTPLMWAAYEGDATEAARLLKAGADVKATNNYGVNAMVLAADIASTEVIQLLLKSGADANSTNADGETALHLVARSGNLDAARMLIKAGARVDARDNFGQQTPLMWAVARRHAAMVDLLVSKGADVNARGAVRDYQRVATAESRAKQLDRGGLTPLMYAARENCRDCVEILLKHGVDVNLPDPSGVSPLVIAMMNNNWDIAKRLVEGGADVNQWDMYGQSPLAVAIGGMGGGGGGRGGGGNPLDSDTPQKTTGRDLVQMLIDRGANPNQQTYFRPARGAGGGGRGTTPFLVAVSSGNIDLVKLLLQKGANPRLSTSEGQGAIILAVQARGGGGGFGGGDDGDAPGGAPPGAPGGRGAGPGAAPAGGAPGAVPPRGSNGPQIPVGAPRDGATASLAGAAPPAGAAPGGGGRGGGAPAGAAGARGRGAGPGGAPGGGGGGGASQVELIKLLAANGADVHLLARRHFLQRSRGGTAMHFAVRGGGNHQVIQALLDLGLDINARDEDGLTALDYAMGRGYVPFLQMPQQPNKALADYLRSVGATVELEKTPDWPPQGAPIAIAVYDSVIWPVDPVGP